MEPDLLLNNITESIRGKDPNAEVFLFGSRARGDNQPDSDWDILILVDNMSVTNEIDDKFRDDLYKLEIESGQIISTFVYSKNHWEKTMIFSPLYRSIIKEGKQL